MPEKLSSRELLCQLCIISNGNLRLFVVLYIMLGCQDYGFSKNGNSGTLEKNNIKASDGGKYTCKPIFLGLNFLVSSTPKNITIKGKYKHTH